MERDIIKRVAAGLRRMSKPPDYFLFIPTEKMPYLYMIISEIPVIYTDANIRFVPYLDADCPFLPCFALDKKTQVGDFGKMEAYKFGRGYYEWGGE